MLGPETGASHVPQDMEGIFGAAKPFPQVETPPKSRAIAPIVARRSDRRARRSAIGRTLARSGVVIAAALAVSIVLAPHGLSSFSSRQIAKPVSPLALADVDDVQARVPPQAGPAVPEGMASAHAADTSKALESRPRRSPVTYNRRQTATQRLALRPDVRRSHVGTPCNRLGRRNFAWCMRPQLLEADRHLRSAYYYAARAGVDRRVLVAYRREWSRLRSRANSNPRLVTVGYRQMARQLGTARPGRRVGGF